jgi:transketolase C-terminal domain/subunit
LVNGATLIPSDFFSMGMAEQNMVGFAAGLAREGFEHGCILLRCFYIVAP